VRGLLSRLGALGGLGWLARPRGPGWLVPGWLVPGWLVPGWLVPGWLVPGWLVPGRPTLCYLVLG
jgi:hypothetical protein